MLNSEEKLSAMEHEIMADVRAESEQIHAETDAEEKRRLEEYTERLRSEAENKLATATAKARVREDKRITAAFHHGRRALLEYREDCAQNVFDEVRRRLMSYPGQNEYADILCGLFHRALAVVPAALEATVYLREADMKYATLLDNEARDMRLEFEPGTFTLGGLMLECAEQRRRIDLSFDSALEDMKGKFSEIADFSMEGTDG